MQTITIGSNSYQLLAMPSSPAAAAIEIYMNDSVATVESPFTRQLQTQQWPGADWWEATLTMPPMAASTSAAWEAFLAGLQGQLNVFQAPDWRRLHPLGNVAGSAPTAAAGNTAMSATLATNGWKPNAARVLLPGDRFQIGYRYHMVAGDTAVSSDGSGNATFAIWPALREAPAANAPLVLSTPKLLLRLAANRRGFQASPQRLTTMSIPCVEVR